MYIYQADTYCDPCGRRIVEQLEREDISATDAFDSDHYPQGPVPLEETDGPDHCASGDQCLGDAVCLLDWNDGKPFALFGAESWSIGELLSSGLTEHGTAYLAEMLAEEPRTPYQEALHRYWKEIFTEELATL